MDSKGRSTLAASAAALGAALAAVTCCLPLAPFVAALGFAGATAFLQPLQPYLVGASVLLLLFGFVQAYRNRACGRRRSLLHALAVWGATVLVLAVVFLPGVGIGRGQAPPGQPPLADFDASQFQALFN